MFLFGWGKRGKRVRRIFVGCLICMLCSAPMGSRLRLQSNQSVKEEYSINVCERATEREDNKRLLLLYVTIYLFIGYCIYPKVVGFQCCCN